MSDRKKPSTTVWIDQSVIDANPARLTPPAAMLRAWAIRSAVRQRKSDIDRLLGAALTLERDPSSKTAETYRPASWFRTGKSSVLRHAAKNGKIRTKGKGRDKLYCVEDVAEKKPHAMP